ncbi:MAG TPA: isoprenylcysteine carboxylmethyltransferase family protein [Bacteroidota bacterium]
MEPIGKMPVPGPILVLGKTAMAACFLFALVKSPLSSTLLYDSATLQAIGIVLAALGLLLVVLGFFYLGRSVSVGLPEEMTELKTGGIYRFTRNPMYLGGFSICIGSCLYTLHLLNILFAAITIGIHHAIIVREEQFLAERFGQAWSDYSRRVPRYLGRIRVPSAVQEHHV